MRRWSTQLRVWCAPVSICFKTLLVIRPQGINLDGLAWIIHDFTGEKTKGCSKRSDEHWVLANPAFSFGASQRWHLVVYHSYLFPSTDTLPFGLIFWWADHQWCRAVTVAGLDQRYGLTRGLAEHLCDPHEEERVCHSVLSLFRQRLYQIIAGYEDANDADRLRYDPAFQILADQPLVNLSDHNQLSVAGRTLPRLRDLLKLQDALLDWFVRICGKQRPNQATRWRWFRRATALWIPRVFRHPVRHRYRQQLTIAK
jgi:hypothetical protein